MSAAREVRLAKRALATLLTHLQQARWLNRLPKAEVARWERLQAEAQELGDGLEQLATGINEAEAAERIALRKAAAKARSA